MSSTAMRAQAPVTGCDAGRQRRAMVDSPDHAVLLVTEPLRDKAILRQRGMIEVGTRLS
jgi:hypothetical protein